MTIEQLSKKIEDLEARIGKLENLAVSSNNSLANLKESIKDSFDIRLQSYEREADGSIKKYWKSAKKVNYNTKSESIWKTLNLSSSGRVFRLEVEILIRDREAWRKERNEAFMALNEMAEEKNHTFSFTIPDDLPQKGEEAYDLLIRMINELVKKFGKGGKALFSDYFIESESDEIKKYDNNALGDVVKYLSDPIIIGREWSNEPFVDNPSWSQEERYNTVKAYVQSLKRKYQD